MSEKIEGRFEIYRVVLDYEALHEGIIDRVEDLNVSRITLDEEGGFQPGYASKLLCNPPMKNLGPKTLGGMLKATGMALVLVVDDERFAATKAQMSKRKRTVPAIGGRQRPTWLFTREKSQQMQVLRNKKLTPHQRKKIARKAAKTRWNNAKGRNASQRKHDAISVRCDVNLAAASCQNDNSQANT